MTMTTRAATPFAIERPLPTRLGAVLDYWRSLLRGEAQIPFSDDVDWTRLEALCPDVFLLGVFDKPERFRLDMAATPHAPSAAGEIAGRFIDEVELPSPLEFLRAQADAAVESMAPTIYQHRPRGGGPAYARVLLPAWGAGKVNLLIGAVEFF